MRGRKSASAEGCSAVVVGACGGRRPTQSLPQAVRKQPRASSAGEEETPAGRSKGPGVDGTKEPPGPRREAGAKLSDTRMDSSPSRRYTPRIASLDKRVIRKRAPRCQRMNLLEESPRREAGKGCDKTRALDDQEIEGGRRHCRR